MKKYLSRSLIGLTVLAVSFSAFSGTPAAADIASDIAALESQIGTYQAEAARLQGQANTYQNEVNRLNAEKGAIQTQISLSQAKYDQLVADIAANEVKLTAQQQVMASAIGDLSVETNTSPIELLAGSGSIGDYIDQQEYSSSVRDQLESSISMVKKIKAELDSQRVAVEIVLNDQKKQHEQLAAKEAQQATLLAQTRGEEAAYQSLIGQKNAELSDKRAAQAAAMQRAGGGEGIVYGASSYPWMDSTMAYDDNCNYFSGGSAADPFGYCKRQCVSYVAWKLNTDGRGNRNYSGLGHAYGWEYAGNGVGWGNVQPGDVIYWNIGGYGHVMYVEWADGGSVGISQMNVPYDSGRYSTKTYSINELSSGDYSARRFH